MATQDVMTHIGDYPMIQQDTEDKFHGKHLLYLHWENHPMFAAPFCIRCRAHYRSAQSSWKFCLSCLANILSLKTSTGKACSGSTRTNALFLMPANRLSITA